MRRIYRAMKNKAKKQWLLRLQQRLNLQSCTLQIWRDALVAESGGEANEALRIEACEAWANELFYIGIDTRHVR